ncbi:MAG: sensor histidine kinase [Prevotella sp.]|nr:sensor histidine kinase [Prevotella sp.]
MFKKHLAETLTYLVLWGILFIAPVLSLYVRTAGDSTLTFDWSEVLMVWRQYSVFFAIFLIHNHLLAPLLVYRQRRVLYFSFVAIVIALFVTIQCSNRPHNLKYRRPQHEMVGYRQPPLPSFDDDFDDGHRPPEFDGQRPPLRPEGMMERGGHVPPARFDQHDIVSTVMLVLMLFANLGIKLYFRQRQDQQQMADLERKNLEQRLEYLKYQLNPHFLMNTLNNIHALVDIDPERSKEAIIQLSKILRYVLYESNSPRVPMTKEREFMDNYTTLMRMRYGDKLSYSANLLDDVAGVSVPPLLFVSFVENAFKHGVSYQHHSFIAIDSKRYKDKNGDDRLLWTCRNSKHAKPANTTSTPSQGGVGLSNVRQRLDLIYGEHYSLGVNEADDTYEVILDIPLKT